MKCKYDITKESTGWWGTIIERYCRKHNQLLASATCEGCPDYFPQEEKDETKS